MFERYFKMQLKSQGYPEDMDLRYSISCCQGDGVAWYGTLNGDDLNSLAERLYTGSAKDTASTRFKGLRRKREIARLLEWLSDYSDDSVKIAQLGSGHYHHYNTMEITSEHDHEDMVTNIASEDAGNNPSATRFLELESYYEKLWSDFLEDIKDNVQSLSRRLYEEGVSILLNTSHETETVWRFETQQFKVELDEIVETELDICFDHYDDNCFIDTVNDLINDKTRLVVLKATLYDRETDEELAVQHLSNVIVPKEKQNRRYDGIRQDLVEDLISEYRDRLFKTQKAA